MASDHTSHPAFWMARLAVAIAAAEKRVKPADVRTDLRAPLEDFLRSDAPSEELRGHIREVRR